MSLAHYYTTDWLLFYYFYLLLFILLLAIILLFVTVMVHSRLFDPDDLHGVAVEKPAETQAEVRFQRDKCLHVL